MHTIESLQEQMLELKDNVEITHAVSGVPLAQFNFMLDACSVLASSYKVQYVYLHTYILLTVYGGVSTY